MFTKNLFKGGFRRPHLARVALSTSVIALVTYRDSERSQLVRLPELDSSSALPDTIKASESHPFMKTVLSYLPERSFFTSEKHASSGSSHDENPVDRDPEKENQDKIVNGPR